MEQSGFTGLRGLMVSRILGGGWKRMIAERLPAAAALVGPEGYMAGAGTVPAGDAR